jgi:YVTN family beta-propeller protein
MFMPNTRSNTVTMIEGISGGPAASTLTVIPVPGDLPEGIDLSPDGREIWTATRNDGGVSIIDVATRTVVQTLDLGLRDANRLKFTPDGRVLIIDGEAASVVVMDAASRTVIKRVTVGATDTGDGAVLVAPDGTRAYLGLRAADRVAVLDLNTLEVTQEMPMGEGAGPGCMYWVGAN